MGYGLLQECSRNVFSEPLERSFLSLIGHPLCFTDLGDKRLESHIESKQSQDIGAVALRTCTSEDIRKKAAPVRLRTHNCRK